MAIPPRFDLLRACFLLLAIVVLSQVLVILAGGMTCYFLFITGRAPVGSCQGFLGQVREIWTEVLAAVLALLLAARGTDPPDPPPGDRPGTP